MDGLGVGFASRNMRALWALGAAALIAGCASSVKLDEPAPVENRSTGAGGAGGQAGGASAGSTGQSSVANVDLTKGANAGAAASTIPRTIYFDFDSYVVKDEYRPTVDAHAKMLSADRKRRITIEGHTDERGGREYNLALGQKRAEAVLKSLTLLGATPQQVEAVSYGKERPVATGSDEDAWAKNRRAEIIAATK